jgi:hypothetical protein
VVGSNACFRTRKFEHAQAHAFCARHDHLQYASVNFKLLYLEYLHNDSILVPSSPKAEYSNCNPAVTVTPGYNFLQVSTEMVVPKLKPSSSFSFISFATPHTQMNTSRSVIQGRSQFMWFTV